MRSGYGDMTGGAVGGSVMCGDATGMGGGVDRACTL